MLVLTIGLPSNYFKIAPNTPRKIWRPKLLPTERATDLAKASPTPWRLLARGIAGIRVPLLGAAAGAWVGAGALAAGLLHGQEICQEPLPVGVGVAGAAAAAGGSFRVCSNSNALSRSTVCSYLP
jgi:hypothetical protein